MRNRWFRLSGHTNWRMRWFLVAASAQTFPSRDCLHSPRFNYGKKSPRRYDSIFYDQKISVFLARFISVLGGHETSRCKNELALTIPVALPHMSWPKHLFNKFISCVIWFFSGKFMAERIWRRESDLHKNRRNFRLRWSACKSSSGLLCWKLFQTETFTCVLCHPHVCIKLTLGF